MMAAMSPVQARSIVSRMDSTGFVRNYFDLVNVRRDNERLKAELAQMKTDQSRLVELETENRHLTDCWISTMRSAVAMRSAPM